jgi:hypothetical protein
MTLGTAVRMAPGPRQFCGSDTTAPQPHTARRDLRPSASWGCRHRDCIASAPLTPAWAAPCRLPPSSSAAAWPGRPGHHRAAPRHRAGGTWRRRAGGGHRRLCPGAEARRRRHGRWRRPCHRRVREDRLHRPGPAGARRSKGLSRPGRRSCLSRRAGTNPHRLSAVDPGPGYRESSPCHSDRVAVLMTRTKRTRSAAGSNLLLPLPAAL